MEKDKYEIMLENQIEFYKTQKEISIKAYDINNKTREQAKEEAYTFALDQYKRFKGLGLI